jgi:hypothetical protein
MKTTCAACHQAMTLIEDGQTTHPSCDPPAGDIEIAVKSVRSVWPGAEIVGQWHVRMSCFPVAVCAKTAAIRLTVPV